MQYGATPLHRAAERNSKDCLKILLSKGAGVKITDEVSNHMT